MRWRCSETGLRSTAFSVRGLVWGWTTTALPSKKLWQEIVGEERVIPIEFKERIVDTALLLIANTVGQGDTFLADFIKRQKGTAFADVNINSVKKSMTVAQSGTGSKGLGSGQEPTVDPRHLGGAR